MNDDLSVIAIEDYKSVENATLGNKEIDQDKQLKTMKIDSEKELKMVGRYSTNEQYKKIKTYR